MEKDCKGNMYRLGHNMHFWQFLEWKNYLGGTGNCMLSSPPDASSESLASKDSEQNRLQPLNSANNKSCMLSWEADWLSDETPKQITYKCIDKHVACHWVLKKKAEQLSFCSSKKLAILEL